MLFDWYLIHKHRIIEKGFAIEKTRPYVTITSPADGAQIPVTLDNGGTKTVRNFDDIDPSCLTAITFGAPDLTFGILRSVVDIRSSACSGAQVCQIATATVISRREHRIIPYAAAPPAASGSLLRCSVAMRRHFNASFLSFGTPWPYL